MEVSVRVSNPNVFGIFYEEVFRQSIELVVKTFGMTQCKVKIGHQTTIPDGENFAFVVHADQTDEAANQLFEMLVKQFPYVDAYFGNKHRPANPLTGYN